MTGDGENGTGAYEEIFNAVNEAILVHDVETLEILDANRAAEELFGYSASEFGRFDIAELTVDDSEYSPQVLSQHVRDALDEGETHFEWRIERKDGTERDVEVTLTKATVHGDEVLLGVARDVTEREERKVEFNRWQRRFNVLFETLPTPVVFGPTWPDGPVIEAVNPAFEETFGYEEAELEGEPLDDYIVPQDVDSERLNQRIIDESTIETKVRREAADGIRDFKLQTAVLPNEDPDVDAPYEGWAIYTDITEQVELQREAKRLYKAVETARDGIAILDDDDNYSYVNDAHVEIYGYGSPEEMLGESWQMLYEEDELERFETEIFPEIRREGEWRGDAVGVTADGKRFLQEVSLTTLDSGRIVCVVRDITDRKAIVDELEQKNERLESFASVVAHDIRNPLTVAKGYLEVTRETDDLSQLDKVERGIERTMEIVENLLALARAGEQLGELSTVELDAAARDAWDNVQADDTEFVVSDQMSVEADRSRLLQLLENLFRNAAQHAGDGVTVRLGTFEEGFYVADDGCGIPESERDRLFESHQSDDKMLFGLAIVSDIAEAHGWDVDATESADGGARFEIRTAPERETSASLS
jgi:PAS domain S-box-containing protein